MDVTADIGISECGSLANSSGRPARLTAHGSPFLSDAEVTLWFRDNLGGQIGIHFSDAVAITFGP